MTPALWLPWPPWDPRIISIIISPGVISVEANPVGQTANVAFDPARTSVAELRRWVEGCGYHCAGQSVPEHSVGFDPMTVRRGDGLRNLEQRSAALGGTTSIDSVPGKGTTVRIELSL